MSFAALAIKVVLKQSNVFRNEWEVFSPSTPHFFFVVDLKAELTNKYLNYTTFDQKQTHKSYKAKTNAPD